MTIVWNVSRQKCQVSETSMVSNVSCQKCQVVRNVSCQKCQLVDMLTFGNVTYQKCQLSDASVVRDVSCQKCQLSGIPMVRKVTCQKCQLSDPIVRNVNRGKSERSESMSWRVTSFNDGNFRNNNSQKYQLFMSLMRIGDGFFWWGSTASVAGP